MPGLYSHTTRATGTVLTAAIYNTDHQNHISNHIPTMIDDHSVNVAAMQLTTDPGEVGTESLPTHMGGELERLRFAIKELKDRVNGAAVAQWYVTATGDLAVADGGTGSSTAAGARTNLGIALDVTGATLPIASGGTGQTTATNAFNALDPMTTKGDIIVHDGSNSVRHPIGTNGHALVADSAQSSGLKWAALANVFTTITAKTAGYNIVDADRGVFFEVSNAVTITMDPLANISADFFCYVLNVGNNTVTLNPSTTEVIEMAGSANAGNTTIELPTTSAAPFNVNGVMLYKGLDGNWKALPISESHGRQHFTGSGTFNVPQGVGLIWVTGQGGGGAGGGAAATGSGGGRGGSSGVGTYKQAVGVTPGASHAVTIGAGGAGVSAGTGNDGGTTSLGALVTLAGGSGGLADSVGVTTAAGLYSNASSLNNATHGGTGGGGMNGGAGAGLSGGNNGNSGRANSGAGGGGAGGNSISAFSGGAGGSGFLLIEW